MPSVAGSSASVPPVAAMHPRIPDVAGSSPGTGGCIWTRMPSAAGFKFGAAEPNPDAVLPVASLHGGAVVMTWRLLKPESCCD